MKDKVVIIDGQSFFKEIFYQIPDFKRIMNKVDNAVCEFMQSMLYIIEKEEPSHLFVVFSEEKTESENTGDLPISYTRQMKQIKDLLEKLEISVVQEKDAETCDIVSTILAQNTKQWEKVLIYSNNVKMLQMVSENTEVIFSSILREEDFKIYSEEKVIEEYGVSPRLLPDLYAILACRDSEEKGNIGIKTAAKLLQEFPSFEEIVEGKDELLSKRVKEKIIKYSDSGKQKKLRTALNRNCSINFNIESACLEQKSENILAYLKKEGLSFGEKTSEKEKKDREVKEIKSAFVKVLNWSDAEKAFSIVDSCAKKQNRIGLYLLVEDDWLNHLFYENEEEACYTEKGGQLSFFEVANEVKSNLLLALAVTVQDKTYYIDCSQDWFQELKFVSRLHQWMETNFSFSVLDGKRFLYIVNALFEQYKLDNSILNYQSMQNLFDVSIAKYLVSPLQDSYEYQELAKEYLDITCPSAKEILEKKTWEHCKTEKEEAVIEFCCYQSHIAEIVTENLLEDLKKTEMLELYTNVEMPLLYVLFQMEQRGIRVNKEALLQYGTGLISKIEELEKKIYSQAGEEFNINSPKQLGVILFEKMGLPNGKKTKTGYSTSAEVLEGLKSQYAIVADILEYRQLTKLKSTYADGLIEYISPVDGRIHGKFNQTVTATGRLSSTEPNLQNIPIRMELGREIRKVFIPKEGYVFLDADYSQIELRILAHMSGDESLICAYNTGKDIHRITASEVFHTPFEEVTAQQRSNAKAVNFGIVYGISSFGLGQDLNISRKEAQEYIERYFSTYPGIKKYLDESVEQGKKNGYVVSLMGRRRPVPELASKNFNQRSFGERVAMNSPIQGTAADIIKLAMIRVNDRIQKEGLRSQLLLQIHDELLVETHIDEIEAVRKILEEEMDQVIQLSVPLEIDVQQGNNWNEAH